MAYTDGSASGTAMRVTARAGWGVYFYEGCQHNKAEPLIGPIQSSARSELRALLHVLLTAGAPHLVRSDCKYVVDRYKYLQAGGQVEYDWQDSDLWAVVHCCIEILPDNFIEARWMPAHLDESSRRRIKEDALRDGIITAMDINGNVGADRLANEGRDKRALDAEERWGWVDRKVITMMMQSHLLAVWKHFEAEVLNGKTGDNATELLSDYVMDPDQLEIEELERIAAEAADEHFEDSDVFGCIDADGFELEPADKTSHATEAAAASVLASATHYRCAWTGRACSTSQPTMSLWLYGDSAQTQW
ncbi:MAG: RNase H family protein [Promethearchaeia archaeon]